MDGKDLVDAPSRHRLAHEHRASGHFLSRLTCTPYSRLHLSQRDSMRHRDTPTDKISCITRFQRLGGVIGLLGPPASLFDQLHAAPVDDPMLAALRAENDQRRPP